MAKILDFKSNNTTIGSGASGLTNVVGLDWNVSRNSIAYYQDTLLTEVAVNVPRIQDSKVLIEAQATNIIEYSEDFSTWWAPNNGAVSTSGETDPKGGLNATVLTADGNGGSGAVTVFKTGVIVSSGTNKTSVYAKAGTLDWLYLRLPQYDTEATCFFDLTNGLIGTQDNCTGNIISVGNGWYLCTIEWSTTTDLNGAIYLYLAESDGDFNVPRDGSSSVHIFGANVITEDVKSSYIYSNAGQATREADVITNTVPVGTAPITMTTWIDDVSDGGQVVNQGDPITMVNGTTSIEIDDSAVSTTTVEVEWIDSISAAATGNKIYRDDVEIADIANGIQIYQDDTAETGTTYKYEVQAYSATDETTQEVLGVNVQYITTA